MNEESKTTNHIEETNLSQRNSNNIEEINLSQENIAFLNLDSLNNSENFKPLELFAESTMEKILENVVEDVIEDVFDNNNININQNFDKFIEENPTAAGLSTSLNHSEGHDFVRLDRIEEKIDIIEFDFNQDFILSNTNKINTEEQSIAKVYTNSEIDSLFDNTEFQKPEEPKDTPEEPEEDKSNDQCLEPPLVPGNPYEVNIGFKNGDWKSLDSNNNETTITAYQLNGEIGTIYIDNNNKMGVSEAVRPHAPKQIEHDTISGNSEFIIYQFSGNMNKAEITVTNLFNESRSKEIAKWEVFLDGDFVSSGTIEATNNGINQIFINTGENAFNEIKMSAAPYNDNVNSSDSSDFFVQGIKGSGTAEINMRPLTLEELLDSDNNYCQNNQNDISDTFNPFDNQNNNIQPTLIE